MSVQVCHSEACSNSTGTVSTDAMPHENVFRDTLGETHIDGIATEFRILFLCFRGRWPNNVANARVIVFFCAVREQRSMIKTL